MINWVAILVALLLIVVILFIPMGWVIKIALVLLVLVLAIGLWWFLSRNNNNGLNRNVVY